MLVAAALEAGLQRLDAIQMRRFRRAGSKIRYATILAR